MIFYNRVRRSEANIVAAKDIVRKPWRYSKATREAAQEYLNAVDYNPRHLPVPLRYDQIAKLSLFDISFVLDRLSEAERKEVLRFLDLGT